MVKNTKDGAQDMPDDVKEYVRQWDERRNDPILQHMADKAAARKKKDAALEPERQAKYAENREKHKREAQAASVMTPKPVKLKYISLTDIHEICSKIIASIPGDLTIDERIYARTFILMALAKDYDFIGDEGDVESSQKFLSHLYYGIGHLNDFKAIRDIFPVIIEAIGQRTGKGNRSVDRLYANLKDLNEFLLAFDPRYIEPMGKYADKLEEFATKAYEQQRTDMPLLHDYTREPSRKKMFESVTGDYDDIVQSVQDRVKETDNPRITDALHIFIGLSFAPQNSKMRDPNLDEPIYESKWYGAYLLDEMEDDPDLLDAMRATYDELSVRLERAKKPGSMAPDVERFRNELLNGIERTNRFVVEPAIKRADKLSNVDEELIRAFLEEKQRAADEKFGIPREARLKALYEAGGDESLDGDLRTLLIAAVQIPKSESGGRGALNSIAERLSDMELYYLLNAAETFAASNPGYEGRIADEVTYSGKGRDKKEKRHPGAVSIVRQFAAGWSALRMQDSIMNDPAFQELGDIREYSDLMKLNDDLEYLYGNEFQDEDGNPMPNLLRDIKRSSPYILVDLVNQINPNVPGSARVITWLNTGNRKLYLGADFDSLIKKAYNVLSPTKSNGAPNDITTLRTPSTIWRKRVYDAPENVRAMLNRSDYYYERNRLIKRLRDAAGIQDEKSRSEAIDSLLKDMAETINGLDRLVEDIPSTVQIPPNFRERDAKHQFPWMAEAMRFRNDVVNFGKAVAVWKKNGYDGEAPAPDWTEYGSMEDLLKQDPGIYSGIEAFHRDRLKAAEEENIRHMRNARKLYPVLENMDMWHSESNDVNRIIKRLQRRGLVTKDVTAMQLKDLGNMTMSDSEYNMGQRAVRDGDDEKNKAFIDGTFRVACSLAPLGDRGIQMLKNAMETAKGCHGMDPSVKAQIKARKKALDNGGSWDEHEAYIVDINRPATYNEEYNVYRRMLG